jgi:LmbE family N-acetylglucosaminyl deacetylase
MSNVIFSPHTDDAIFSLGDYILDNERITIASAFSGVPTDDVGYKKHTLLRQEHDKACAVVNAKVINNDLLDDVYGKQDKNVLTNWVISIIKDFDHIYIPLGIHHPDHILLSDTIFSVMDNFVKEYFFYSELPYRVLYPQLYEERLNKFKSKYSLEKISTKFTKEKLNAIKEYGSQIDENLIEKLLVEENLWKVIK